MLVELMLDYSVTVNRQTLKLDDDMVRDVERLSRNMCSSLYQKRSEILSLLMLKKWYFLNLDLALSDKQDMP